MNNANLCLIDANLSGNIQVLVTKSAATRVFILALFLGISNPVSATVLGFTDILESPEPSVLDIIDDQYGSDDVIRINDYANDSSVKNTDVEWNFLGDAVAPSFVQIAKHAGYFSEFGIIYQERFWSLDGFIADFGIDPGIKFYLGIRVTASNGNQFLWSSNDDDNSDGLDHMVTWVIDEAAGHYAVAFEDLPNGGDQDFNDLVVEVIGFVDGPVPQAIPEPAILALMGFGLVGIGFRRRKAV